MRFSPRDMSRPRTPFVVGLLAALGSWVLMAPSGGFPYFPTFGAVGIGTTAPTSGLTVTGGLTTTQAITASGVIVGNAGVSSTTGAFIGAVTGASYAGGPVSGTTATFTGTGIADSFAVAGTNCTGLTTGQLCVGVGGSLFTNAIASTTGAVITVAPAAGFLLGSATGGGKGGGTINATALYQNGIKVPLSSYAQCNGASTGLQGASANSNVGTCTFNSTGNYTVTFSTAYTTNTPICTASGTSGQITARVNSALASVGIITTISSTAVLTNDAVYVSCVGT